jgi:hypothetical protein
MKTIMTQIKVHMYSKSNIDKNMIKNAYNKLTEKLNRNETIPIFEHNESMLERSNIIGSLININFGRIANITVNDNIDQNDKNILMVYFCHDSNKKDDSDEFIVRCTLLSKKDDNAAVNNMNHNMIVVPTTLTVYGAIPHKLDDKLVYDKIIKKLIKGESILVREIPESYTAGSDEMVGKIKMINSNRIANIELFDINANYSNIILSINAYCETIDNDDIVIKELHCTFMMLPSHKIAYENEIIK